MKVVDASVALKWFVEENGAAAAGQVLTVDLVAPTLILSEIANGLWKKWRHGAVTREQALTSIGSLPLMLAAFFPVEPLVDRAVGIAIDVDHPVYDCFYVALAEQLQVPFVTADSKMIRAFAATRYASLFEPLA